VVLTLQLFPLGKLPKNEATENCPLISFHGSQKVPHQGHVERKIKYEPGSIEVRGLKDGKVVLTEKRETTGLAVAIRLTADRLEIDANGEDLAVLKVEALDKEGRAVPTAGNLIGFKVSGDGALIGVGNGDPKEQAWRDSYRGVEGRLGGT